MNHLTHTNMKTLAVKIYFTTETSTACLSNYNISVEFDAGKTKIFNEIGNDSMLKIWCERVLQQRFPQYKSNIIKIEKL